MTDSPDDAAAVRATLAGDREAFRALVERHGKRVFLATLRILGDRDEAEDAAQEAFLKAYAALRRYDARWAFSTWVAAIAARTALDAARRRRVRGDAARPDVYAALHPQSPEEPRRAAERNEAAQRLRRAMDGLGERMRRLIELHHLDGLALGEIAGLLGETPGAVKVALHRARRALRDRLKETEGERRP